MRQSLSGFAKSGPKWSASACLCGGRASTGDVRANPRQAAGTRKRKVMSRVSRGWGRHVSLYPAAGGEGRSFRRPPGPEPVGRDLPDDPHEPLDDLGSVAQLVPADGDRSRRLLSGEGAVDAAGVAVGAGGHRRHQRNAVAETHEFLDGAQLVRSAGRQRGEGVAGAKGERFARQAVGLVQQHEPLPSQGLQGQARLRRQRVAGGQHGHQLLGEE